MTSFQFNNMLSSKKRVLEDELVSSVWNNHIISLKNLLI